MHHLTPTSARAAIALLALVMVACAPATGADAPPTTTPDPTPVATPDASPTPRVPDRTPVPVPSPSEQPQPEPSEEPEPSNTPAPIARHRVNTFGRVIADGVNVRILPGLDQPLIDEEVVETREIRRGVRLEAGHPVVIGMGPVVVDGIGWYQVTDNDGDRVSWLTPGWVAGQFLEVDRPIETSPITVAFDGHGVDVSASGDVAGGYGLVYNVMAAPRDGATSCHVAVTLVVDGAPVPGVELTVSEPTLLWQSQLENAELFADAPGTATIDVDTDCSVAGFLREVTQG